MADEHLSASEAESVALAAACCEVVRPELTDNLRAGEIAALREGCSGRCSITQSLACQHGELVQVLTHCGTCHKHRTLDARPPQPMPQLA